MTPTNAIVRSRGILAGLALTAALSGLASASVFAAQPTANTPSRPNAQRLNPQQLGILERLLKYCGPVDPASSKKLQAKFNAMVKGASPEALSEARSSDRYKEGYSVMDGFIGQVDQRNAKIVCTDSAGK